MSSFFSKRMNILIEYVDHMLTSNGRTKQRQANSFCIHMCTHTFKWMKSCLFERSQLRLHCVLIVSCYFRLNAYPIEPNSDARCQGVLSSISGKHSVDTRSLQGIPGSRVDLSYV